MKKLSKVFLFFASVLTMAVIIGCGDAKSPENQSAAVTNDAAEDNGSNTEEDGGVSIKRPDIPANDFGGRDIVMAVPVETLWGYDTVCPEAETGEPVYDATYRRNKIIEDRYNVNLKQIDIGYLNFEKTVKNSILAQDNMFDIIFPRIYQAIPLSSEGHLYDLNKMPYIDSSNIWWDSTIVRDCSLAGKMFSLAGDIHMYAYDGTFVLYFNKLMHQNYGIENLYQLVADGKWTIDKFDEIMRMAAADLDGDGKMTFDDQFGIFSYDFLTVALLTGCNSNIFEKISETEIVFNMNDQKFSDVIDKINRLMNDGEAVFNPSNSKWKVPSGEWGYAGKLFTEDRALFMCEVLDVTRRYRYMESDFGVLPFPKYDESQSEYYSLVVADVIAVSVPSSMPDENAEMIGSLIEDMAFEGRNYILPAYYDITLLRKNTRDAESAAMLDIIFRQRKYAVDMTYNFGGMRERIYTMVNKNQNNVVSLYEQNQDKVQAAIDKLLDAYAGM
ncbi:MAG: hypothetical protein FWD23_07715 [Oscillospiraceae bacterium]|nr:hypothetical protein [Oscillospiraceae bacterium]